MCVFSDKSTSEAYLAQTIKPDLLSADEYGNHIQIQQVTGLVVIKITWIALISELYGSMMIVEPCGQNVSLTDTSQGLKEGLAGHFTNTNTNTFNVFHWGLIS